MLGSRPNPYCLEEEAQSFAFRGLQAWERPRLTKYCTSALPRVPESARGAVPCQDTYGVVALMHFISSITDSGGLGTSDPSRLLWGLGTWVETAGPSSWTQFLRLSRKAREARPAPRITSLVPKRKKHQDWERPVG